MRKLVRTNFLQGCDFIKTCASAGASAHEDVSVRNLTQAELDAPHPDPARRERFPTVGHMAIFYATWHETYHSGQLSAWRRVQGLPPV
jgi:uncharacterized damage-inducible protein DinB